MANAPMPQEAPEQGGVSEVLMETDENLSKLAQLFSQSKNIPPELGKEMVAVREHFASVVDAVMKIAEGQGSGQQPADQGAVPMEAGAKNQAVQAY